MREKEIDKLVQSATKPSDLELKDQKIRELRRDLRLARREAVDLRKRFNFLEGLGKPVVSKVIPQDPGAENTSAVAILVASDWHVEELVDPRTVSGLNRFNPKIARRRAETFFTVGERLVDIISRDLNLDTIVLALLGDFITNELHEDSAENNAMTPMESAFFAQELIASGINYLLENTKQDIIVPCHSGNHARTTRRVHHAMEKGHSIEWLMYCNLAKYFEHEDRVTFNISDGYHSHLDILGVKTRFHHGHKVNYHGGIGGITIPVNKAVAQWDKAKRADLDIFGHFHQHTDGGKWFCNGSLIGYNAFAVSIKAEYEPPRQGFLVVDKKRGRTYTAPIYVER